MTKKDFKLIAGVLDDSWDITGNGKVRDNDWNRAIQYVAEGFAACLPSTNHRFERARFMKAAGAEL